MSEWVVLDIEGTLSATDQVLVTLYDYARPRLGLWIDEHADDPAVTEAVAQIRELSGVVGGTDELQELRERREADREEP